MLPPPNEFQDTKALVVDGNLQSRTLLASQLRDLGVGSVVQCGKLSEARAKLQISSFDIILCEQHFEREETTGQDLLDDLRRNQLLPFHTVFAIVTAEATYTKVAEAAESALDAYLVKPHTANGLSSRITQARQRKLSLKAIFAAIEQQRFTEAGVLCTQRFTERGPYGLYAARIGAELMLRTGQLLEAQQLFEAVVTANTLPWAKLGVARTQLEAGQTTRASTTLESLIESDPDYTDAYDLMGRAQFELGNFQNALNTFGVASKLTPGSVNRLLKHGMLAYHAGEREEGVELLERATRIGLASKLYDPQALVLLAFARLDNNDQKGLQRCHEQMQRLSLRQASNQRLQRLLDVVRSLLALQDQQTARTLDEVRRLAKLVHEPSFDFESASNLLALMTRLAMRSIQLYEVDAVIDTLGLRFCTSRALTELLACSAGGRDDFAQRIRAAQTDILKLTEEAMALSLKDEPQQAAESLLAHGERTLNAKLIESAHLVLQRYTGRIADEAALTVRAQTLRERYRTTDIHAGLGEQARTGRAAGGVALPGAYKQSGHEGPLVKASSP
jgi:tetratricopeptide (TPR) repeat protein